MSYYIALAVWLVLCVVICRCTGINGPAHDVPSHDPIGEALRRKAWENPGVAYVYAVLWPDGQASYHATHNLAHVIDAKACGARVIFHDAVRA